MSTWDDKPNDYEHACRIIKMLQSEIVLLHDDLADAGQQIGELSTHNARMRAALKHLDDRIFHDPQVIERAGEMREVIRAALEQSEGKL